MSDKIEQWITVHPGGNKEAKGQPIPVKEGQTKKEAIDAHFDSFEKDNGVDEIKKRTVKKDTYWIWYDSTHQNGVAVTKQQYEKAELQKWWKKGYEKSIEHKEYELDFNAIGLTEEQINDKLNEILNGINESHQSWNSFENMVAYKLRISNLAIPTGELSNVINAFNEEIGNKYDSLIKPMKDNLININKDTARDIFKKSLNINNDEVRQLTEESFETLNDEGKQLMAIAIASNKCSYRHVNELFDTNDGICFSSYYNSIFLDNSVNNICYNKGQTVMHETAHMLDNTYKIDSDNLSESFETSNGKTLQTILKSETFGKKGKEIIDKIIDDYNDWKENYKKSLPGYQQISNKWREVSDKLSSLQKEKNGFYFNTPESEEYEKSEEFVKAKDDYFFLIRECSASGDNKKIWGDVSDIVDGMTYGKDNVCSMGHKTSYWKASARAREFFAEYMSAKVNNQKSYELIKKYFPESSKAADEIIEYIIKNRSKIYDR